MDLTTLNTVEKSESGAVLEVLHPATGIPIGVTITLAGMDSSAYRKSQRVLTNKRMKMAQKAVPNRQLTAEELEADSIDILAKCTLGWDGVEWKGNSLPFSIENARMLYTELPWLREQVDSFISDRANFLSE